MTRYCVHDLLGNYKEFCFYCKAKELGVKEPKMLKVAHEFHKSLKKSYSGHGCDRCGEPDQPYALHDSMWEAATDNTHERFLCLECVKLRLGIGTLKLKHFVKAPINYGMFIFDVRAYLKHSK